MNKKGFTLIELLAVIIILAIVALIATPVILNIIEDAKTSALKSSAEFYIDGVNLNLVKYLAKSSIPNGSYKINADGDICIDTSCNNKIVIPIDGEKPTGGKVKIINSSVGDTTCIILDDTKLIYNNGIIVSYDDLLKKIAAEEYSPEYDLNKDGMVSVIDNTTALTACATN